LKPFKNIATLKEVTEQLNTHNLELLFKDLVVFALNRMKGSDIIQAEKLVGDIFEKTVTGIRKWNKSHSFKSFLFLAVKSLVSQYNDQFGEKAMNFNYDFELEELSDTNSSESSIIEGLKTKLSETLKRHIPPPDEIEEMVFECWMDEMKKPKDIAEFWEIEVTEVYKAIKRLERKLNPIRALLNSMSNE
jgi:DNA-directed RNA polymerase specialized sigma24 family protein